MSFGGKSTNVRIAQYEWNRREPKRDLIEQFAEIFDVAPEAIQNPDIDTKIGLMHTLFQMEDLYGLTVTVLDGYICLKQDINHPKYNKEVADDLRAWYVMKNKLTTGSISKDEYDEWRYKYPISYYTRTDIALIIQAMFSAPTIDRDLVLYRQVSPEMINAMIRGNRKRPAIPYREAAFMSTSMVRDVCATKCGNRNDMLKIYVPKGTHGIYANVIVPRNEAEFLLPPEMSLKMIKEPYRDKDTGKEIYEVELIRYL